MLQSWTHKNLINFGSPATRREMRVASSQSASLCNNFDNIYNPNFGQKQILVGGLDRTERKI